MNDTISQSAILSAAVFLTATTAATVLLVGAIAKWRSAPAAGGALWRTGLAMIALLVIGETTGLFAATGHWLRHLSTLPVVPTAVTREAFAAPAETPQDDSQVVEFDDFDSGSDAEMIAIDPPSNDVTPALDPEVEAVLIEALASFAVDESEAKAETIPAVADDGLSESQSTAPVAAAPPREIKSTFNAPRWAAIIWACVTTFIVGRLIAARGIWLWRYRHARRVTDRELRQCVGAISRELGMRRRVEIWKSPRWVAPVAWGVWRPSIGLPEDFQESFTRAEQDAMLAHELGHLAARDPAWQCLADAVTALLWWAPWCWWLRKQMRIAAEWMADEASLLVTEGPQALAECLVTLGRRMAPEPAAGYAVTGSFRSNLGKRVARLLELAESSDGNAPRTTDRRWRLPALVACVALSLAAGSAWARSGIESTQGAEDMRVFEQSWRRSLAGGIISLALGAPTAAVAQDSAEEPAVEVEVQVDVEAAEDAEEAEEAEEAAEAEAEEAADDAEEAAEEEEEDAEESEEGADEGLLDEITVEVEAIATEAAENLESTIGEVTVEVEALIADIESDVEAGLADVESELEGVLADVEMEFNVEADFVEVEDEADDESGDEEGKGDDGAKDDHPEAKKVRAAKQAKAAKEKVKDALKARDQAIVKMKEKVAKGLAKRQEAGKKAEAKLKDARDGAMKKMIEAQDEAQQKLHEARERGDENLPEMEKVLQERLRGLQDEARAQQDRMQEEVKRLQAELDHARRESQERLANSLREEEHRLADRLKSYQGIEKNPEGIQRDMTYLMNELNALRGRLNEDLPAEFREKLEMEIKTRSDQLQELGAKSAEKLAKAQKVAKVKAKVDAHEKEFIAMQQARRAEVSARQQNALEMLRKTAAQLRDRGQQDAAEQIEEVLRALADGAVKEFVVEDDEVETDEANPEVDELRSEVKSLRGEIAEIRDLLKQSLQKHEDAPPKP
jgi:beta-lactamase regulating signal transducer with metallopeptidase domain